MVCGRFELFFVFSILWNGVAIFGDGIVCFFCEVGWPLFDFCIVMFCKEFHYERLKHPENQNCHCGG